MDSGASPTKNIPSLMNMTVSVPEHLVGYTFPTSPIPTIDAQEATTAAPGTHNTFTFGDSSVRLTIIDDVPVDLTANSHIAHPETGNRPGANTNAPFSSGDVSARFPTTEEQEEAFAEMLRGAERCLNCIERNRERRQSWSEEQEHPDNRRFRKLEDEILEMRTDSAKKNKEFNRIALELSSSNYQLDKAKQEILRLKKLLPAEENPDTNETGEIVTNHRDEGQKQNNVQFSSSNPSNDEDDSSVCSEPWDFSNDPTVQKRRKFNNND